MSICKKCGLNVAWRRVQGKNCCFNASDFSPHKCSLPKTYKSIASELRQLDQSFKRALENDD